MRTLDDQQRAILLDRVFRRIGRLDDQSLIQFDEMIKTVETGKMPAQVVPAPSKPQVDADRLSRRYFLAALVAGAVVAAASGGAAAVALSDEQVRQWLAEQGWMTTSTPPAATPGPSPTLFASPPPTLPAAVRNQIAALQNQVASLTTERDNLREQVVSLGGQVRDANGQIVDLKSKNGDLLDLADLYRQLEGVNLDQVITAALNSLGVTVLAIDTVRTALNTGIALAVRVLQGIEDQLPLIAAGVDWLERQVATLSAGLRAFQTALAVTGSAPLTQSITNFVSQVLDILPFGVGQNTKLALQAMGDVLSSLPDLLNNVNVMVLEPLRTWVGTDNQGGLRDSLLHPLREQLLTPAQQIVANAENLNTVYNTQLAQPVQSALDQRAKIRSAIDKKAGAITQ